MGYLSPPQLERFFNDYNMLADERKRLTAEMLRLKKLEKGRGKGSFCQLFRA